MRALFCERDDDDRTIVVHVPAPRDDDDRGRECEPDGLLGALCTLGWFLAGLLLILLLLTRCGGSDPVRTPRGSCTTTTTTTTRTHPTSTTGNLPRTR